VEILLLGPPEVHIAGRSIPIGGRRQRIVLVLFAMNPGQVLTTDWLVDQLWAGSPPPSGIATVRSYISRLRSVFEEEAASVGGSDLLVRRQSGYSLQVEPEEVDVHRFDRSIDDASAAYRGGEPVRAARLLRDALALWRGSIAFGDLAYEPFALTEYLRLTERRLEARALCMDCELASCRHDLIVSELQQLVTEYPLRERFWQQLMVALYRSGRQADALETYARLRHYLVDELGIEPAPETRQLEDLVLRQSHELDLPPRPEPTPTRTVDVRAGHAAVDGQPEPNREPSNGSSGRLPLVGRQHQLDILADAIGHGSGGSASLAVVVGEPGCGKSRLLSELADRAGNEGFVVARGSADEDAVLPYAPFGSLVRSLLDRTPPPGDELDTGAVITRDLAWLVPELGEPPTESSDPGLARARLTESVLQFFRTVEPDRPLLLLVDDAHRLGRTGAALLRAVLDRLWSRPMAVVIASRPPGDPEAKSGSLERLLHHENARAVEVGRLSQPDVLELVEAVGLGSTSEESDRLATLLMDHSGGLPLLIRELVVTLAEGSKVDDVSLAERAKTSVLVRSIIGNRLARLSGATRRILETAAVVGFEIEISIMTEVSGRPRPEVIHAVDDAARLGLVVEQGRPDKFRFDHALVRGFFAEEVSALRRSLVHADAAAAYGARGLLVEAADHALVAADELGTDLAAAFVLRGARSALSSLDFERSRDMCAAMLNGWDTILAPCTQVDLLLVFGKALSLTGERLEAQQAWCRAAELAREIGDPECFLEVALSSDAHGQIFTGSELRWRLLAEAMEIASDSRSSLYHAVATAWAGEAVGRPDEDFDEALFHSVLADAEASRESPELSLVICHTKAYRAPQIEERRYWWKRLEHEAAAVGNGWLVCGGIFGQLAVDATEANGARVAQRLAEVAARLEDGEHPAMRWFYETASTSWARIRGLFDQADLHSATSAEIGERFAIPDAIQGTMAHLMLTAFHRGTLDELHSAFVEAADVGMPAAITGIPAWHFGFGLVLQAGGDHAGAWNSLSEGLRRLPPHRHDDLWEITLGLAAELVVGLEGAPPTGVAEAIQRIRLDLAPLTGNFAVATGFSAEFGPIDRSLGLLASSRGDERLADHHFLKALETCRRMEARTWELRTQADHQVALIKTGREPAGLEGLEPQLIEAGLGGALTALRAVQA
jgi:DNA-binding SARP family transcriptional activator